MDPDPYFEDDNQPYASLEPSYMEPDSGAPHMDLDADIAEKIMSYPRSYTFISSPELESLRLYHIKMSGRKHYSEIENYEYKTITQHVNDRRKDSPDEHTC